MKCGRLRKKCHDIEQHGSSTVELSLLMGIILAVLTGILYLNFFWHDQAFLQSAAYEAACCAGINSKADVNAVVEKQIRGRLLGTKSISISGSSGKKEVQISCEGEFKMPGMSLNLFEKTGVTVRAEVHFNTESPSRRIQKIRGLMKIADTVKGETK